MTTYVFRPDPKNPGQNMLVEKHLAGPHPNAFEGRRAFMVIKDFTEPVRSTITGEMFSSKGGYHRHVKDNGCEVVGNDLNNASMKNAPKDDGRLRDDIAKSIGELS